MNVQKGFLRTSTIIPTYNRAKTILRAVHSALNASRIGDEVIVIDDGSTDETYKILSSLSNKIHYISVENRGAGAARNIGIKAARNPLVAFLDSDDEWLPDKLDLHRSLMQERPEIVFSFSDFKVIDKYGKTHNNYLVRWHNDIRRWDEILNTGIYFSNVTPLPSGRDDFRVFIGDLYPHEMVTNYISTITLVVRRDLAGDALWFPEDLSVYEDWECYARLSKVGPGAYLECETAINHGHTERRLTDADIKVKADTRMKILERVWGCDAVFLTKYREHYLEINKRDRVIFIKEFLTSGKMDEAREYIKMLDDDQILLKILGILPGFAAKQTIYYGKKIKKLFRH